MLLTWAFLSLAFSQSSRNFLVHSTTFEIKSYSRCWLTLFGVSIVFKIIGIWILIFTLGNHRALMTNIFRAYLTTIFPILFMSILNFWGLSGKDLLIYSNVQNRSALKSKSLFRKILTKAIPNALDLWAVWNDALEWCREVINLTRSWIRLTEKKVLI